MTDLQLALLGGGAVVIVGVLAYNAWVERRARAGAERAFGRDHADVLLDGERREPTLNPITAGERASPSATAARSALLDDDEGLEAPAAADCDISNRIDTVAVILADDPVTREALEPLYEALQAHAAAIRLEGIVDEQWQPVESSRKQSWRELRAGLQLASRSGPLGELEINNFNETIAAFAASVTAVSQRESPAVAAERAKALDRFCADTDIEVAVNVTGQFGATFAMARVKALALEQGLSETGSGALVSLGPDGVAEFAIRRLESIGGKPDASYATGLTFALDVPHVADPAEAFARMVQLADLYAESFGGERVDDNRKPLSDAGVAAIARQLEQVVARMHEEGIPPGGRLARRLYA